MIVAARVPARRSPANRQLLRPVGIGRIWFSTQLLSADPIAAPAMLLEASEPSDGSPDHCSARGSGHAAGGDSAARGLGGRAKTSPDWSPKQRTTPGSKRGAGERTSRALNDPP
jgi:hypothetical protein